MFYFLSTDAQSVQKSPKLTVYRRLNAYVGIRLTQRLSFNRVIAVMLTLLDKFIIMFVPAAGSISNRFFFSMNAYLIKSISKK